jgi:aldose 1-epimerase
LALRTRRVSQDLVLEAPGVRLVVASAQGARMRSLVVHDRELLVTSSAEGPIRWGCYPMAPWAGRVRNGRFPFGGREHELPLTMPPNAIHGTVYDLPWRVLDERALTVELLPPWPFAGRVVQRFDLQPDHLQVDLELIADQPMPAVVGWHPWFLRRLEDGAEPAVIDLPWARTLRRDENGIPTGDLVPPLAGPWDDAFTVLDGPVAVDWPGQLRLEVRSTCHWYVIYTVPEHALCVEPQSGPPNAFNVGPGAYSIVKPGQPLVHTMTWRWIEPSSPRDRRISRPVRRATGPGEPLA